MTQCQRQPFRDGASMGGGSGMSSRKTLSMGGGDGLLRGIDGGFEER